MLQPGNPDLQQLVKIRQATCPRQGLCTILLRQYFVSPDTNYHSAVALTALMIIPYTHYRTHSLHTSYTRCHAVNTSTSRKGFISQCIAAHKCIQQANLTYRCLLLYAACTQVHLWSVHRHHQTSVLVLSSMTPQYMAEANDSQNTLCQGLPCSIVT